MVVDNNINVFVFKLLCYFSNIIGLNVYWYKVKEDLKVIISYVGVLIFFFIFFFVDMYWFDLYVLFSILLSDIIVESRW